MSAESETLGRWRVRQLHSSGRLLPELAGLLQPRPRLPEMRIGFLGGFSAGKSTLISTLLGERVAEAHTLPTSRCVTAFVHRSIPVVSVYRSGALVQHRHLRGRVDWERRWNEGAPVADLVPDAAGLVGAKVAVGLPSRLLAEGFRFIDTPGHDSLSELDDEAAQDASATLHAAFYLCPVSRVLGSSDLPVLDALAERRLPWALVLTHAGRAARRQHVRAEIEGHVHNVARRWLAPPPLLWGPAPFAPEADDAERVRALVCRMQDWRRAWAALNRG